MKKIIALFFCFIHLGNAVPGPSIKVGEVSGVVEKVVWRGEIAYDQSYTGLDGKFAIGRITSKPSWLIILKDVKGLDDHQISEISDAFSRREPSVSFSYLTERNPKFLYLWIAGESSLEIMRGHKLILSHFSFQSDEYGGSIGCGIKIRRDANNQNPTQKAAESAGPK